MNTFKIIAVSLLTASASFAGAETLTSAGGVNAEVIHLGDRAEIVLSYEPDQAKASSLSFELMVPSQFVGTDDSHCLSELPDGISGGCRFVDGRLKVIIYNPQNDAIQPAVIGRVSLIRTSVADSGGNVRPEFSAAEDFDSFGTAPGGRDSVQGFEIANVDMGIPKR